MDEPSTVPSAVITPQLAQHVLWHFGQGGYQPGEFTELLLRTIAHADSENRERLRIAFPNHVRAFLMGSQETYGIDRLKQIAAGA